MHPRIDASSMLARPLLPYFLDTYSLSMSFFGCNALCVIISFLVLWFICLSSSFVHFKKGPEYLLNSDIPAVYHFYEISAADFSFDKFSRSPEILFSFFSVSSRFVWRCPLPIFQSTCNFLFLQAFWLFLDFFYSFHYLSIFNFSLWGWHIFLCQIPFQCPGCIFLLFVPVSNSIFIFCKQLDVIHVQMVINFLAI